MRCPDDERLAGYVELRLEERARAEIEAHLRECEACRDVVTQLAVTFASSDPHGPVSEPPARAPGSRFGRYLVVELLGQGAMGVVYSAYDPDLDRRVAIKVLRQDKHAEPSVQLQRRQRSVREARALASISHPNVITIHDVGVVDDEVFIAMELIRGRTLAAWLRAETRSPADVVEVLTRAGQGLWAAHAEGVVHRDFKPENVMVADDARDGRAFARVLVTDFGLARIDARCDPPDGDGDEALASGAAHDETLTVVGALLGTPAYMAPEQLRGETADARSDQFSFCAVLFEALLGERPFRGVTATALLESMRSGVPAMRGRVDRRLEAVLARGLAPEPADRFASMGELLDALARARERRSVRWAIVFAGTTALVAAAGVSASVLGERRPRLCADTATRIADVWNDDQRAAIAASFAATPMLGAGIDAAWAQQRLDAFASRWTESYHETCTATLVDGVQSESTMEMRVACLQRAKGRLVVVVDALTHADESTVQNVGRIVDELPALDPCDDVERLRANASLEPAPKIAERVEAVRAELTRAELLRDQGRFAPAERAARAARRTALEIGHPPLDVESALVLVDVMLDGGGGDEAEALARDAYTTATRYELDELSVRALDRLGAVLRPDLERRTEARFLSDVALALAARVDPGGRREAEALAAHARLLEVTGEYIEAVAVQRRALANIEAAEGADERLLARYTTGLGNMLWRAGEPLEAEQALRRAVELLEQIDSPDHLLFYPRSTLAVLLTDVGRFEEAEAIKRWALTTIIVSFGPQHAKVATAHSNLAAVLHRRGDLDGARRHYLAALTIYDALGTGLGWQTHLGLAQVSAEQNDMDAAWTWAQRARDAAAAELGADHYDVTRPLGVLGFLAAYRGDRALALEYQREIVDRTERLYGPDHLETARALVGVADTLSVAGPYVELEPRYRRAVAGLQQGLPADHETIAFALQNLADVVRLRGELVEARALLELVWSVRSANVANPVERGLTAFSLATVLGVSPTDRERALDLARVALELCEASQASEGSDYAEKIRTWLARGTDSTFLELAARGLDVRGL